MTTNYKLTAEINVTGAESIKKVIESVSRISAEDVARRFFRKHVIPMAAVTKTQVTETEATWIHSILIVSETVVEDVATDFNGTLEPIFPTVDEVFAKIEPVLVNLFSRWADEKDYEDWADYHSVAEKELNGMGVLMTSFTSRPFVLKFKIADTEYAIGRNKNAKFALK